MRSARARGHPTTTMALLLSALLAGGAHAIPTTSSAFGRRLLSRRGYSYGFLAPAGMWASTTPSVVVRASAAPNTNGNANANTADLVARRGGATAGGGVFGSITRLFSGGSNDAIRTEAPAVGAVEAAGAGAGEGWKGDLLVLPVFQPEEGEGLVEVAGQPILAAWDKELGGAVAELVQTVRLWFGSWV